jgi:hypothetical protein
MASKRKITFLVVVGLLLSSCTNGQDRSHSAINHSSPVSNIYEDNFLTGKYRYQAFDVDEMLISKGFLIITGNADNKLHGTLDCEYVGGKFSSVVAASQAYGPQFGHREIAGNFSGVKVIVHLDQTVDHTVHLNGTFANKEISGVWEFETDAGISAQGRFVAQSAN